MTILYWDQCPEIYSLVTKINTMIKLLKKIEKSGEAYEIQREVLITALENTQKLLIGHNAGQDEALRTYDGTRE